MHSPGLFAIKKKQVRLFVRIIFNRPELRQVVTRGRGSSPRWARGAGSGALLPHPVIPAALFFQHAFFSPSRAPWQQNQRRVRVPASSPYVLGQAETVAPRAPRVPDHPPRPARASLQRRLFFFVRGGWCRRAPAGLTAGVQLDPEPSMRLLLWCVVHAVDSSV